MSTERQGRSASPERRTAGRIDSVVEEADLDEVFETDLSGRTGPHCRCGRANEVSRASCATPAAPLGLMLPGNAWI